MVSCNKLTIWSLIKANSFTDYSQSKILTIFNFQHYWSLNLWISVLNNQIKIIEEIIHIATLPTLENFASLKKLPFTH